MPPLRRDDVGEFRQLSRVRFISERDLLGMR